MTLSPSLSFPSHAISNLLSVSRPLWIHVLSNSSLSLSHYSFCFKQNRTHILTFPLIPLSLFHSISPSLTELRFSSLSPNSDFTNFEHSDAQRTTETTSRQKLHFQKSQKSFQKFWLKPILHFGAKMVLQVRGRQVTSMPETLPEFFEAFPELGEANRQLTSIPHTQMWRDQVWP